MKTERWDSVELALSYALHHGIEKTKIDKVLHVKRFIGLKIMGCTDYLRSHGYIVQW